jgi:hypothetical protein
VAFVAEGAAPPAPGSLKPSIHLRQLKTTKPSHRLPQKTQQIVLPMLGGLFLFDLAYLAALLYKLNGIEGGGGGGGGGGGDK